MSFPIKTKNYRAGIGGLATDFSFSVYADRTLVLITQVGSVGTFVSASQDHHVGSDSTSMQAEESAELEECKPTTTFSTTVLFGRRDEPMFHLCARQIIEIMQQTRGKGSNLLLGLGLRDHSIGTIKAVVDAIRKVHVWG